MMRLNKRYEQYDNLRGLGTQQIQARELCLIENIEKNMG